MKAAIAFSILLLSGSFPTSAQSESDIKNMIESRKYIFIAQYALPMRGTGIYLSSEYDLTVSGDSIISWLPYYGRAYQAPLDPNEGGIKFTSTKFKYTTEVNKKGGWDISMETKDVTDTKMLTLHVSVNGNATLQVTSIYREPISFTGYIKENNKPK